MPMFEVFKIFEKNGDKFVVTFEPIMQFCCPSRFRILKTLQSPLCFMKKYKKWYRLAVIDT